LPSIAILTGKLSRCPAILNVLGMLALRLLDRATAVSYLVEFQEPSIGFADTVESDVEVATALLI
jgi:hypothetical protein